MFVRLYLTSASFWQVPPYLVRKVFTQIFSFINVQLFNRLVFSTSVVSGFWKSNSHFYNLASSFFL